MGIFEKQSNQTRVRQKVNKTSLNKIFM